MKIRHYALMASVASIGLVQPAYAQQDNEAEVSKDSNVIIVTAERREQTLQDYAGTASTFSGEDLKKIGVQNITDLQDNVPGLSVANNQGNIEVYIRGVGSSNNTELGDPAAAFHFDGVYIPRPRGIGSAFFDIERVEVNVGPQGTLRGRNATAGSVNAISWKPGLGVWDASVEAEYGNYDQKVLRGVINAPLGEKAALRVSGMYLQHDSYYNNVGPVQGIDVAEAADNYALRAQLLFKPTDRLSILIAGDYINERGTGYTGSNYANPLGNGVDPDDVPNPRNVIARGFTPIEKTDHWGIRAVVTYEADPFTIEFTSSYRDVVYDYDAVTPLSPFYPGSAADDGLTFSEREAALPGGLDETVDNFSRFQSITDSRSFYNELRFFNNEGPFIWSAGLNYFREDQYAFLGSTGDRGSFFQGVEFNIPNVDADAMATYVDMTYEVTDKLRLTGGLRYTTESKSREGVASRYGYAIGDDNFNCCMGVRLGTEGFRFAGRDRMIFNPDTNGDGAISEQETIDFHLDGIAQFGARDNLDEIVGNGPIQGHFFDVPNGTECVDTNSRDGLTCNGFAATTQFTFAVPFQGQIFRQSGRIKDDFIDWRLRAEYDITDDNLLYALVSNGHKSGGFNDNLGDSGVAPTYGTEQVRLYEIGSKNEFYLGSVKARLNATAFYNDYDDQVFTSLLSVNQIVDFQNQLGNNIDIPAGTNTALVVSYSYNAADSEIYGAQLEGGLQLPGNLNWNFNALWLEAKIKNAQPIQDFRFQADVAPNDAVFQSINGKRLPRTPRWQFNTSISQTFDLPNGAFDYVVSVGYRSSQFMTIFNSEDFQNPTMARARLDDRVGSYWTVDAGVGYSHGPEGKYRVEAYVNNLTNAVHEAAILITQFDNTRFFTRPRTYGGRVRVKF